MTRKMMAYGYNNFKGNGVAYGCCPGHDSIFYRAWKTRACQLTNKLRRYPKKVERQNIKNELKKQY